MTELQREAPYYDKVIPLHVQNGPDDVKNAALTFRVIPGSRPTLSSGQTERLIHFEVSIQMIIWG